jgi:hypothetical protein
MPGCMSGASCGARLRFAGVTIFTLSEGEINELQPANDNIGPHGEPDAEKPSAETWRKIDRVALTLARIIGRRMAEDGADKE